MSGFLLFALGVLCGAGLVLALRRGGGRDLTGPPRTLSQPRPVAPVDLPRIDVATASRDEELLDLIRRGRKIEAIKHLRDRTGLGLREAKDAIEALERTVG
ncbi:ribosomal protein L7/L12 [Sphingopyxis sp.]|uniref:ribosomal protein L7/L12 n=1 Tax=Sphingopyxis sp. TaxID=1908224 RepID=UPI0035B1F664